MDQEEKELLRRVAKMAEDNNAMLKGIRSSMRWASIRSWIYWIVIIGISIGAFWFLQPYLDTITKEYSNASSVLNSYKNFGGQ